MNHELKLIIKSKLLFIANNRHKQHTQSGYIEDLLNEKKKLSQSQSIEERIAKYSVLHRAGSINQIKRFYCDSVEVMRLPQCQGEPIDMVVKLYASFFRRVGVPFRGEQVIYLRQKRLCQTVMIIPTIINWLFKWSKKVINEFLNEEMIRVCSKLHTSSTQESNLKPSSCLRLETSEDLTNHEEPRKNQSVLQSLNKKKDKLSELKFKYREQRRNEKKYWEDDKSTINQVISINRDIVIGAFSEQFQNYYDKLKNCIDLDTQYVKKCKKNDRKSEIKARLKDVCKILAKHQNNIKQSIDQYYEAYNAKFKNERTAQISKIIEHGKQNLHLDSPMENFRGRDSSKRSKIKKQTKICELEKLTPVSIKKNTEKRLPELKENPQMPSKVLLSPDCVPEPVFPRFRRCPNLSLIHQESRPKKNGQQAKVKKVSSTIDRYEFENEGQIQSSMLLRIKSHPYSTETIPSLERGGVFQFPLIQYKQDREL